MGQSPAGPLIHEHRVIERLIVVLQSQLGSIADDGWAEPRVIDAATDFIRTYADRCHHGKEEDILFRRLESRSLEPELARMMEDLVQDHVRARGLTRRLSEANERYATGEQAALAEIEESMRSLVELYPGHIEKEDKRFFKPCLEYFSEEERLQMLRDFDAFDRSLIHEKYLKVVEGLEAATREARR